MVGASGLPLGPPLGCILFVAPESGSFNFLLLIILNKETRARRTIGAKDKREVTSQKILKISFENIVAKLNK